MTVIFDAIKNSVNFSVIFNFEEERATENIKWTCNQEKMSFIRLELMYLLKLAFGLNQVFNFGPLL